MSAKRPLPFYVIAAVFQLIMSGGYLLVWRLFAVAFPALEPAIITPIGALVALVLSGTFLVAIVGGRHTDNALVQGYYTVSVVWFSFVVWAFYASVIFAASNALVVVGILSASAYRWGGVGLYSVALLAWIYSLVQAYRVQITRYTVRIKDLPHAWQGRTVALISDAHFGHVYGTKRAERIAKRIEKLAPDMVWIIGDFFDGPPTDYAAAVKPFGLLSVPHGVWFTPGNHEEYNRSGAYLDAVVYGGMHLLIDEAKEIDGVRLVGVSFMGSETERGLKRVLEAHMHKHAPMPTVLFKHAPTALKAAQEMEVDLVVCGHTHAGQLPPVTWIARRLYGKFNYGLHKKGETQVLTSSGVGTWGPPIRFGSRSEIVYITFVSQKAT